MIRFENKVALITGGSRGIGRAIAEMFAGAGCDVAINYRSNEAAANATREACEARGVRALAVKADIGNKAQVDAMVQAVIDGLGRIDILVNNAGIWVHNPIDDTTEERIRETIDTNLMGVFFPCMAVAPHMKRQKSGSIINISSTAGQRGEAFYSPYGATKAAVIGLTKSLAAELVDFNIRVNCVAPGWVKTDMTEETLASEEGRAALSKIRMKRAANPEELAGPVVFLASDLATFITGEILNVNGGAVLCG